MGKPSRMTLENLLNNFAMEVLSDEQQKEYNGYNYKGKIEYLQDMGFIEPVTFIAKPKTKVEQLMDEITEEAKAAVELHGYHIEISRDTDSKIESIAKHQALLGLYHKQPIGWLKLSYEIKHGVHHWTFVLA